MTSKHTLFAALALAAPFACALACGGGNGGSGAPSLDGGSSSSGSSSGGSTSSGSSGSSSGSGSSGSSSGSSSSGSGSSSGSSSSSSGSSISDGDAGLATITTQPGYIAGVTSDGQVIYAVDHLIGPNDNVLDVAAIPFAGGPARAVVANGPPSLQFEALGTDVLCWNQAFPGGLYAWSSTTAALSSIGPSSVYFNAAVSPSSSQVFYSNQVNDDFFGYVANGDGTQGQKLLTASDNGYYPYGQWGSGNLAVEYQPVAADGGAGSPVLALVQNLPNTASVTNLATLPSGPLFSLSTDGTLVYAPTLAGPGQTFAMASGTAGATIDTSAQEGYFLGSSDTEVVYRSGSALKKSTIASPAPSTLVSSGVGALYAVSPDGSTAVYTSSTSGGNGDLWLAPTASASSGVQVLTAQTGAPTQLGGMFTKDSSHVLFMSTWDVTTYVGTLAAVPTSATSASQVITLGTTTAPYAYPATGAKVVYCVNEPDGGADGCDLTSIDLSAATPTPTVIAAGVGSFELSPDGTQVAYSTSAGLQISAVP